MSANTRSRRSLPWSGHQRGVALITAVLVVALAAILAVNVGFKGYLDQRRSATNFALDQGYQVALGAEAWAADILKKDKAQKGRTDDLTEEWATPIPPIPVDGGEVTGQVEDMQGRFNLNSLVIFDQSTNKLVADPGAVKRFQQLLEILELEPKWADVIVDWIDSDTQSQGSNGAEDDTYSSLTPAYRTANMPVTRSSELLALSEFGLERYRKLEPYVTALPMNTTINLCTASGAVIDAMSPNGQREFSKSETMKQSREQGCFPSKAVVTGSISDPKQKQELEAAIGESSDYFRATVVVTIGTTQFTLYSLLKREQGGGVRPILRSFGTP